MNAIDLQASIYHLTLFSSGGEKKGSDNTPRAPTEK